MVYEKNPNDMSDAEKSAYLKEMYGLMGTALTDDQINTWLYMRSATITGSKPKEISVSVDLLFSVFQVLDQLSSEITTQETALGRLPFDGTCSCPKHTWLMPAYNEIGEILNNSGIGIKDLSVEFQYGMKMMQEAQHKMMLENSERIGGSGKESE